MEVKLLLCRIYRSSTTAAFHSYTAHVLSFCRDLANAKATARSVLLWLGAFVFVTQRCATTSILCDGVRSGWTRGRVVATRLGNAKPKRLPVHEVQE